ncbi:DUF2442 domain-containing protein [Thiococcus pfennigii]|uniref:DUF2442 domain-containing protein n=1 Tax=Thiococcus pfennigii TaxID=1057 RepID=UPI001903B376|nr:DUF2442 domain-containing protein [Thiococcus pfennigii]MBK1702046.1 hypothetical protein [Thiococcus pfennigii]
MKIATVVPIEDHILFVEAEEGSAGVFDLKPYLGAEVFAPLQDPAELSAVHNGGYFLEWPCGADLSADTIEANLKAAPPDIAQGLNRADPRNARRAPRNVAGW